MWIFILLFLVPVESSLNTTDVAQNYSSPCSDENHLFLVPGALTAGSTSRACVSRFHVQGPARMELTMNPHHLTAVRELPPGDGGCVDLTVPMLPNTKVDLIVKIRYPEAFCSWERRLSLRITSGRVVTLHTERARYRPGDTLRARVLVLKGDLTPAHGNIDEIWLEGPRGAWEGVRAAQWTRVRSRMGIAQVQYQLDEQAPPGKWTIRARLNDGSQGASEFYVGNYEIPPFQLSVRHADRVLRTNDRLIWTVCVRYPWTEAVEGMLVIRLRGAGGDFNPDATPGVRTAVRLRTPKACHRHAIAAKRVGLNGVNPPDVIVADFSFQEEGTRIWQNTTVVSQVVDKPITLEFLTKHRAVIAPGLPYKLKVKATRWDDKPAASEGIRVCRAPAHENALPTCDEAVTDEKGIARVMFVADDDAVMCKFQATLKNETTTSAPPLYLPVRRPGSLYAALGPLRDYNGRSFIPLYLSSKDINTALTVHFVVVTRGGTIYRWGATTQCPISSSTAHIRTAIRNSGCNPTNIEDSAPDNSTLDKQLLRVMLPVRVTHQMCPDSHLVAYFFYKGQLVSASKHFEMEECFANKMEATWSSRQVAPGSPATLTITTQGPALCALSVLDSAVKAAQPAELMKEAVMKRLRRMMEDHRNLTEYDASGECFLTTDTTELPSSSLQLTSSWLAGAGLRALGGGAPPIRCLPAPAPLQASDVMEPRSDFSEAWLWRLVVVGSNGSVAATARAPDSISRFEAGALCVSRTGVAISPPVVLQVFREFFIHADNAKKLKRGDATIIRYRIFNYLYEPLSVEVQVLADPHLEVNSNFAETACVGSRSSVARWVEVRATLPGSARISIRAKSVEDSSCGRGRSGVSDEVIIQIKVEPEGIPVQDHQSIMLCGKGSLESRSSSVSWSWPAVQAAPGSEDLTIWATGDVIGPLLADADALVQLPRGCGEQNMARLATNLLALEQLQSSSSAGAAAREHVARGFTRQLQYAHPSGGFSAFGIKEDTPSTWLTAFAVRYLRRAHQVISPGLQTPPALERAERWLLGQQMENGCFRNEGQVFHRELKGGLNEEGEIANVALTAYVVTSLVESSAALPHKVLHNSLSCLRALPPLKNKTASRVYAQSLLAYAFMRLKKYEDELRKTNEASLIEKEVPGLEQDEDIRELVNMMRIAQRKEEYVWWETGSLSSSIEATGYALQALCACPAGLRMSCAHDARGAARWLATHRNAQGGFMSTQDTLVALEALITWSASQPPSPTNLTVTARSGSSSESVNLTPGVRVPEIMKMAVGDTLEVDVEGSGCALIQATRSYNAYSAPRGDQLAVQVGVRTEGPFNCEANGTFCFCAAVVEACVLWTGEFPEMALLDVVLPSGFGADASLLYAQLQQPNTLVRRIELTPGSGRATLYLAQRSGALGLGGHACYQLHAVGPAAFTKPAYVRIQDYYVPQHNDTQTYIIPEDCPSSISNRNNDYLRSDNLFSSAKSIDDGGIIITDEFSFEDVPEGIPLEDPLYDNLTDNKDSPANIEKVKNTDDTNKQAGTDVDKSKTVSDNEIKVVKIDDKIERDFETEKSESVISDDTIVTNDGSSRVQQTEIVETAANEKLHKIEIRDDSKQEERIKVDNPKLSDFHVIESDKDLDVPTGIEGPVAAVVLPPKDFVTPSIAAIDPAVFPSIQANPKAFPGYPTYGNYYFYTEIPRFRYVYKKR